MSYMDIIENLIPDKVRLHEKDVIHLYKIALQYLNKLKCYRANAMFFGSMQMEPEMYTWKESKRNIEFTQKYQSCCIYIMNTLYQRLREDKEKLISMSLFILYSMLGVYVGNIDYMDEEIKELLDENDKYKDNKLEGEFNG